MDSKELKDTLDFIQKYHSWENMMDAAEHKRHIFKYIDICYDTRGIDNVTPFHVWSITLRQSSKETLTFSESKCNLKFIIKTLSGDYNKLSKLIRKNTIFQ